MVPVDARDPAAVVRTVLEGLFRGDVTVLADHPGLTELRQLFPTVLTAFPDFGGAIEQQLVDGQRVATHSMFRGTHRGAIFGIPPTNRAVRFQNISIARVVEGKIVQYNSETGWLAVLMQIGVLPLKS